MKDKQTMWDIEQRGEVLLARHPQLQDVVRVVGICIVSLGCEDICRQASRREFNVRVVFCVRVSQYVIVVMCGCVHCSGNGLPGCG